MVRGGDLDGFWSRVEVGHPLGCWQWVGYVLPTGYANVNLNGQWVGVHRLSYELLVGPIRDGLVIDHLCRNTSCVNPDHLEPVTSTENTLRGYSLAAKNARKKRCKRGHELTIRPDGYRHCQVCRLEQQRERRRKARA